MKLCFDATSFGSGLDGAVELASARKLKAVEYSFEPFAAGRGKKVDDKEQAYLASVRQLAIEKEVEFACLNLNFCLDAGDKKAVKQFLPMIEKLGQVAAAVGCKKVSFHLQAQPQDDWMQAFVDIYPSIRDSLGALGVSPLLSLSTPVQYRGLSLKKWRALDPQEWRDLLSSCENLALIYSPADCLWLGIDYLVNLADFASGIDHVVAHDIEINRTMLNDSGLYGPLWWRYRMVGSEGLVDWRQVVEALKLYGYMGTVSIQFEDEFLPADDGLALDAALTDAVRHFQRLLRG